MRESIRIHFKLGFSVVMDMMEIKVNQQLSAMKQQEKQSIKT